MFPIAINKIFEWFFSRVLSSPMEAQVQLLAGICHSWEMTLVKFFHKRKLYAAVLDV
jgi:hypothetical protein